MQWPMLLRVVGLILQNPLIIMLHAIRQEQDGSGMQVTGNILRLKKETMLSLESGSGLLVTGSIMFMDDLIDPMVRVHREFITALIGFQEDG